MIGKDLSLAGPGSGLQAIWPEEAIKLFEGAWIETPFQLVSIALGPSGIETLADLTGLSRTEVTRLIESSQTLLTDNEKAQLSRTLDVGDMSLGALKPKR